MRGKMTFKEVVKCFPVWSRHFPNTLSEILYTSLIYEIVYCVLLRTENRCCKLLTIQLCLSQC